MTKCFEIMKFTEDEINKIVEESGKKRVKRMELFQNSTEPELGEMMGRSFRCEELDMGDYSEYN